MSLPIFAGLLFLVALLVAWYNYRQGQPFLRSLFYAVLMMAGLAAFIIGAFGKHFQ